MKGITGGLGSIVTPRVIQQRRGCPCPMSGDSCTCGSFLLHQLTDFLRWVVAVPVLWRAVSWDSCRRTVRCDSYRRTTCCDSCRRTTRCDSCRRTARCDSCRRTAHCDSCRRTTRCDSCRRTTYCNLLGEEVGLLLVGTTRQLKLLYLVPEVLLLPRSRYRGCRMEAFWRDAGSGLLCGQKGEVYVAPVRRSWRRSLLCGEEGVGAAHPVVVVSRVRGCGCLLGWPDSWGWLPEAGGGCRRHTRNQLVGWPTWVSGRRPVGWPSVDPISPGCTNVSLKKQEWVSLFVKFAIWTGKEKGFFNIIWTITKTLKCIQYLQYELIS